jgi:Domain of unknown function (DUF222)
MYERLVGVRGQLAELVTAVDPDAVSGSTARQCWAEFDRIERLAAAGKTLLARRVADTHRPDRSGSKTPAEDLARKAGSTTGSAKDAMDTSQRLPEQPELDRALRRGQLSPAQAGLISAAAAADPAAERRLTELAGQVSLAELRAECARVRAAADPDPEATNRRLHADRRLRRWTDSEGFWNLHAKGTPQAGALFNTVLDPIIDRSSKPPEPRAGANTPTPTPSTPSSTWPNTPPATVTATSPTSRQAMRATAMPTPPRPPRTGATPPATPTPAGATRPDATLPRPTPLKPLGPTPPGLRPPAETKPLRLTPPDLAPTGLTPMPGSTVRPVGTRSRRLQPAGSG